MPFSHQKKKKKKILLPCNFQPQVWTDHQHKAPKLYVLSLSRHVDSCGKQSKRILCKIDINSRVELRYWT